MRIMRVVLVALLIGSGMAAGGQPAAARAQGGLRAADPTLVRDGDRWVSLSTGESLGTPNAQPCNPADPVWAKGFAYVPYRVGASADQLRDCWEGDALPGGPGPWATPSVSTQWAPSLARIGTAWWLFYTARKAGTGQQCVGVAAGDRASGPNWLHPGTALLCPPDGTWAIDPEIFYDRQTAAWYLLWRQDPGFCETRIHIQRFDPGSATLTGPRRQLLTSAQSALGFDEFTGAPSCPGGLKQIIENPAMVRADSGQLWLFFSANAWDSVNYATGWAVCGTAGPTEGTDCGIINAFPGESRNRPLWGSATRTAPTAGDPKPYLGFPDLPGFGGMSLATANPTAAGTQPVYATAHMFWGGPSRLRTQFTFRLDTTGTVPNLFEPGAVTIHGRAGTFGTGLLEPTTPSGQPLATRPVQNWGWPVGHNGIFNAVAADGTVFTQAGNTDIADGMVVAGAFDPKANTWATIKAKTSKGFDSVAPFVENGTVFHGGASAWDVQAIGDGNAVAFTNIFGVPWPPYFDRRRIPAEGVWPSFGIVARVGGSWQVINQWSAAELATSNPDSDVDTRACAPYAGMPEATSLCGGLNELAVFPRSRDLIVALYAGDGVRTSGGLMALRVSGPDATGKYGAKIVGYYPYPEVLDINPPNPARPGNLGIAVKTVETDPTGTLGDERFNLVADIWHADDDGNPATIPPGLDPSVTQEFSYNANTGEIRPVAAPFIAGVAADGTTFRGVHGGIYDHQGNLWTQAGGISVYAKAGGQRKLGGPACPFDLARWNRQPHSYTSTAGGRTVWGQTCAPDYELPQGRHAGGGGLFGNFLQLAEDPVTRTIVGVDTWDTGNVIGIRHAGSGLTKTFTVGNLVDTGRNLLPRQGPPEQRPPAFDKTGRAWFMAHIWPPGAGFTQPIDHWMVSVDLNRLHAPTPTMLPHTAGATVTVQAETTATTGTVTLAPRPDGTVPIDAIASVLRCTGTCAEDGVPGDGYQLGDDTGAPMTSGTVDYQVYAPTAGTYRIAYRLRTAPGVTGAAVRAQAGATTATTPVNTGGSWTTVTGPNLPLAAGANTIRLTPTGSGGWYLNLFTLTRT